jgi:hypothetical protein
MPKSRLRRMLRRRKNLKKIKSRRQSRRKMILEILSMKKLTYLQKKKKRKTCWMKFQKLSLIKDPKHLRTMKMMIKNDNKEK